jgi:hypothetical protein
MGWLIGTRVGGLVMSAETSVGWVIAYKIGSSSSSSSSSFRSSEAVAKCPATALTEVQSWQQQNSSNTCAFKVG